MTVSRAVKLASRPAPGQALFPHLTGAEQNASYAGTAVEFTVKADDGKEPRMLKKADIILVGVSRTSKTPLSTYLAHKGYKVGNVPIVLDHPLPPWLHEVDPQRVIALTIGVDAAHDQWTENKPFVLDVRPREQYDEAHIPGAYNVPLGELGGESGVEALLPQDLDAPILSVCQRGNASLSGLLFLKSLGYRNVRSMDGGTLAWREKGYETDSA